MASLDFYSVESENHKLRHVVNWIVDIVVVLVLAVILVHSFGGSVSVSGHSMEPALSSGNHVLIDTFTYRLQEPKRLDVILYQTGEEDKTSIKRIIGLPGETIWIRDGKIYVDGEILELKDGLGEVMLAGIAEHPIRLGPDEYFVLGDNRESSEDSRFEKVGNILRSQIEGKIWFCVAPFVDIGFVS